MSADALPTVQINGVAWAQVVVGNRVYVTGSFTSARPAGSAPGQNETTRSNLLAYDLTTGALITSWAPSLNGQGLAITASADGSTIYVGGSFTSVSGVTRNRVVALSASTGAVVTSFNPSFNSRVRTLAVVGNTLYAGGLFSAVSGAPRSKLAAVNATTGAVLPWAPVADQEPLAMVAPSSTAELVIAGRFSTINGESRWGSAAVNLTTGANLPWAVQSQFYAYGPNAAIYSLSTDGTTVYATGYAYGSDTANLENSFAADAAGGTLRWVNGCLGDTYSSVPVAGVLYTAGHAHDCTTLSGGKPDSTVRDYQYAQATTTAALGEVNGKSAYGWPVEGVAAPTLLHWEPTFTPGTYTGQSQAAWSIAGNSQYVVAGGEFLKVNGTAQQGLTRFAVRSITPNTQGPQTTTAEVTPTAVSTFAGTVKATLKAAWDRDDKTLTYQLLRGSTTQTVVATLEASSQWWNRPQIDLTDSNAPAGTKQTYRIRVSDPSGNTVTSSAVTVTVASASTASSYAARVRTDGATDYWRLDEASGSTSGVDSIGSSNLRVDATNATRGASGATGDGDTATTFTGLSTNPNTQKAVVPATTTVAAPAPKAVSMEAWVKTTSTTGGGIIGYGDSAIEDSGIYDRQIWMTDDGRLVFAVGDGSSQEISTTTTYNDGQWHHVVATMGGEAGALYVDGYRVAGLATGFTGQSYSGVWRIGGDSLSGWANQPSNATFTGTIDDVAIYSSVLSAGQVSAHYTASGRTPGAAPAPVDGIPPVASFRATSSTEGPLVSLDATASADPDGSIMSYAWDFGDGTTGVSAGATTSHTYAKAGIYQVKLTVTDNKGVIGVVSNPVMAVPANEPPTAVITQEALDAPRTFSLHGLYSTDPDGAVASWDWDFGDGTTATGPITQHTFSAGGTYQVRLTVTDDKGATGSTTQVVVVQGAANTAPTAAFTSSVKDLAATFDASASADAEGPIASYAWDFGDGTTGTGVKPSHTYTAAGSRTVTLTVTDAAGATSAVTHDVVLTSPAPVNQAPTAAFTSTVKDLAATVDASASVDSDGTIASYAWDFGDGATATGRTASHTYTTAGSYQVTLTVTDDKGAKGSVVHEVVTSAPVPANVAPTAGFTSSVADLKATLNGSSSTDSDGSIASYAWDFGDQTSGTGATATHTYPVAGTYQVTLTVTDDKGATGSLTKAVTVTAPVPAAATVVAQDTFGRTTTGGWGSAEVGGAWTTTGGAGNFSVDGSVARAVVAGAGSTSAAYLNGVSSSDTDVRATFSLDKAATGGGTYVSLLGRRVGTSDYRAKVKVAPDGSLTLSLVKVVGGTETSLKSVALSGVQLGAGQQLVVRLQVVGTGTTSLNAKAWVAGASEPASWAVTATDTTAGLQAAGGVGVLGYLSASSTNAPLTLTVDDLKATRP